MEKINSLDLLCKSCINAILHPAYIPRVFRILTLKTCKIPLSPLVFISYPQSCLKDKPDPASRQTYCGPLLISRTIFQLRAGLCYSIERPPEVMKC